MAAPVVDTAASVQRVHRAFAKAETPMAEEDRETLVRLAMSALSATQPYMRHAQAPVQQKHFEAIEALRVALGEP